MARAVRHFVAAAALLAAVAYIGLYGRIHSLPHFSSDGYSYYVYLPSVFIYHDVTLEKLGRDWYGGTYPDAAGVRRWASTGRLLDLHPFGTAVLMAPFFLAADLLTRWSNLPRDGFSLYYQHGAGIAGIVYLLLGLALVRRMLRETFSDGVVLATLVCLTWGTNLFHYAVFDGTFSHVYAFFLIGAWAWLVERWWESPTPRCSLAIGVVGGLAVLVRHTNVIYALVLPLYGVASWPQAASRPRELLARWRMLAIAVASAAAVIAPQLALYKSITGQLLVNPYESYNMGFTFSAPHLGDVLFSTQKGLFFWSPILLLSVAGVCVAPGRAGALALPATIVFLLQTLLIGSWTQWQFGASFGHRGFTDGLALAAPFIASSFAWTASHRRTVPLVAIVSSAAVLLSVAQMLQYWTGVLPMSDTTWAQYQDLFLRFR
jgi:hypothetical protein